MSEQLPIFLPVFPWHQLEREILCYGTTRGLRCTRVGMTFFVETASIERDGKGGEETRWQVCAVSKDDNPSKAYIDALEFLSNANVEVAKEIRAIQRKKQNSGEARG